MSYPFCLRVAELSGADLKQSLDAFVDDWNLLLAHPFRWSYTGDGLHEKAVSRFTKILSTSADQLETATLTKQLKLMNNLLTDYSSEIPAGTILLLIDTLHSQCDTLRELVQKESGPVRKKNAADALTTLMSFTQDYDCASPRKAA